MSNGRTARRRAARAWVRRNRPAITEELPKAVRRYVYEPMVFGGDLTHCPYYRGAGTCSGTASCYNWGEPLCITMEPLDGWPRERMARGVTW